MEQHSTYQEAAHQFETKWQHYWDKEQIYHTPPNRSDNQDKFLILDFFPYPSGYGLHVGHPLGYIATDIYRRFLQMKGKHVLYSMGFDSFGLPAEQFAIQTGKPPSLTTEENISNMLKQLRLLGLAHAPEKRFSTTDPDYYRWTQWIFLQLYQSYYDPHVEWIGADGIQNQGRALPISDLAQNLKNGSWLLDVDGIPKPQESLPEGRQAQHSEIPDALNKARLVVLSDELVNWCPQLGTVLSNEEVTDEGLSERGGFPVYQRSLRQWKMRITEYATRLLQDLEKLNWPHGVIEAQRNWIGQSNGAEIDFQIETQDGNFENLTIYTTRPDTLFGATYMVMAPEHPLLEKIVAPEYRPALSEYQQQAALARSAKHDHIKEKTGVFTGGYAINPCNSERVPVWVADYVLMSYGSGAIMAVPASDQRDFEFAKKFNLPIRPVMKPHQKWLEKQAPENQQEPLYNFYLKHPEQFASAFCDYSENINSANDDLSLNGLKTEEAKLKMIDWLVQKKLGKAKVQYQLRDWLFSRQRYWGEPFPIVFDAEQKPYPVHESCLPIKLPELQHFTPERSDDPNSKPLPPLSRAKDWIEVAGIEIQGEVYLFPNKQAGDQVEIAGKSYLLKKFTRELNTMPNWAGSCWYYLRYCDASNDKKFIDPEVEKYWSLCQKEDGTCKAGMVDLYVGGTEHAVLHLLYARFWHKVLYDLGHLSTCEPFDQLYNQGMITADAYKDTNGSYVDIMEVKVSTQNKKMVAIHQPTGKQLEIEQGKMGKRFKNGIAPEDVAKEYTVDTFRVYEMYLGPLDATKPWNQDSIIGMFRFLSSVWNLLELATDEPLPTDEKLEKTLHKTIRKVTKDIERLRMNTAIAALIELKNTMRQQTKLSKADLKTFALLLYPFAPHLGEEMLLRLVPDEFAQKKSGLLFDFPHYDLDKCQDDLLDMPIMVNGKKRTVIAVATSATKEELEKVGLEQIQKYLEGKTIQRIIPIIQKGRRLLNVVVVNHIQSHSQKTKKL